MRLSASTVSCLFNLLTHPLNSEECSWNINKLIFFPVVFLFSPLGVPLLCEWSGLLLFCLLDWSPILLSLIFFIPLEFCFLSSSFWLLKNLTPKSPPFFFFFYFFLLCAQGKWKVTWACPSLCDPMDYTVHGILQARILEWVAFSFFRGPSQPRDWTQVSHIVGRFFTSWATREAP